MIKARIVKIRLSQLSYYCPVCERTRWSYKSAGTKVKCFCDAELELVLMPHYRKEMGNFVGSEGK